MTFALEFGKITILRPKSFKSSEMSTIKPTAFFTLVHINYSPSTTSMPYQNYNLFYKAFIIQHIANYF